MPSDYRDLTSAIASTKPGDDLTSGFYSGDITTTPINNERLCESTFENLTVRCSFGSIRCIDYNVNRHLLVVGEKNRGARIVFPDTYGSVQFGGDETVRSAVFSPDGRFVFTGGDDRIVRMWRVKATDPTSEKGDLQNTRVNPKAALVVESVGPLWGDKDTFHHRQKIRGIDCCRVNEGWVLTSVCEGGRINIWIFDGDGKPSSHCAKQSYLRHNGGPDSHRRGLISWNAVSLVAELGLIVVCGRENSDPPKRRGLVHVYDFDSVLTDTHGVKAELLCEIKREDADSGGTGFQAGWAIRAVKVKEGNQCRLFVGDYNSRIHIFNLYFLYYLNNNICLVKRGEHDCLTIDSTEDERRVFDIALTSEREGHIAICLEDGSVYVSNKCALNNMHLDHSYLRWYKCYSHASRARCAVFVQAGRVSAKGKGERYLISGGFDHRLIKRHPPFDKNESAAWKRKGSSSGIGALSVSKKSGKVRVFTVGQSHAGESPGEGAQNDIVLWENEIQRTSGDRSPHLAYWKEQWEDSRGSARIKPINIAERQDHRNEERKADVEEHSRVEKEDLRSYDCLAIITIPSDEDEPSDGDSELIVAGGSSGLSGWVFDPSSESTSAKAECDDGDNGLLDVGRVWDLAVMDRYVFAACENKSENEGLYAFEVNENRKDEEASKLFQKNKSHPELPSSDVVRAVAAHEDYQLVAAGIDNQPMSIWQTNIPGDDGLCFQHHKQVESLILCNPGGD